MSHVYLSRQLTPPATAAARDLGLPLVMHDDPDTPPSRERLLRDVAGAAALITLLTDRVDAELLDAAGPGLRIVANCAVGFDNVDLAAASARGVVVTNTPGVLDEATADLAFALVLATARRLVEADRFVRGGREWIWGPQSFVGLDVSGGATLGIVGLGRIGMAVARRAAAFGMRILATGSRATGEEARRYGVAAADLPRLLAESDVVSLHCPLTPDTHHLIGAAELAAMKPTAILVNTARGPVVDEAALVTALETGVIAAAGLDVYEDEPRLHPGLRALDNTVLLPHIGSAGRATRDAMGLLAVDNVRAVLAGEPPRTPVPRR
ncbi:2-hydroxyacid dehydrogenase [Blastococcus xanthinilyticus]|uniref:Lactate dehydrogenase-like 2-hydroxyacid dehydrogenase n=1 Tax=Blastococcus xanthinilyticus TaxID=1564164 RepID=A0A5S5D515_9ACTN|nr:D-glycerate dehydrogenase [Blastococcus xanthinilyticus]TYP90755.1 lactate dehydrogenase-like 2-hydroxyacid dehydrogenase [Blastococcus xanthinilyticus]